MGTVNDITWMRTRTGLGAELREATLHKLRRLLARGFIQYCTQGLHEASQRLPSTTSTLQYFLLLSMGLCISTISFRQSTGRIDQGAMSGWTSEELTDQRTSFAQHPATTADILDAM